MKRYPRTPLLLASIFLTALCTNLNAGVVYGDRADGMMIYVDENSVSIVDSNGDIVSRTEFNTPDDEESLEERYRKVFDEAQELSRQRPNCDRVLALCHSETPPLAITFTRIFAVTESEINDDTRSSRDVTVERGWHCDCEEPIKCEYKFSTRAMISENDHQHSLLTNYSFGRYFCE